MKNLQALLTEHYNNVERCQGIMDVLTATHGSDIANHMFKVSEAYHNEHGKFITLERGSYVHSTTHATLTEALEAQKKRPSHRIEKFDYRADEWIIIKKGQYEKY